MKSSYHKILFMTSIIKIKMFIDKLKNCNIIAIMVLLSEIQYISVCLMLQQIQFFLKINTLYLVKISIQKITGIRTIMNIDNFF
jgi:hypothetical protein